MVSICPNDHRHINLRPEIPNIVVARDVWQTKQGWISGRPAILRRGRLETLACILNYVYIEEPRGGLLPEAPSDTKGPKTCTINCQTADIYYVLYGRYGGLSFRIYHANLPPKNRRSQGSASWSRMRRITNFTEEASHWWGKLELFKLIRLHIVKFMIWDWGQNRLLVQ